jgi:hypothetical protein
LSQDVGNLKLLSEKERENLTTQILNIRKIFSELDKKIFENEKILSTTKEFLNNSLKEFLKELEKIKEKINKYEKETSLLREGLLKSPGIIGPSASGIEVLLNNQKKGVYSKLNLIEGTNISLVFSENRQEGRANITINSAGGGYTTIQEEGTSLPQRTTMNFIGSGLTAEDDEVNSRTNIIWDRFLADRKAPYYYTDFLGRASGSAVEAAYPFDYLGINLGLQSKIRGEPNHPGILRISSSANANSGGYVLTDPISFRISGGEIFEIIFRPLVSNNTNTTLRMGFLDATTSADATDGVYFELPANSLGIVGKTANNGVRTTSTTIATLTVNTWYRCRIEINSDATQANFYVYDDNGTLLGSTSITTNIPTEEGRETGAGFIVTISEATATALADFDFMAVGYNGRELTR